MGYFELLDTLFVIFGRLNSTQHRGGGGQCIGTAYLEVGFIMKLQIKLKVSKYGIGFFFLRLNPACSES